jgi:hypothetical protein
MLLGDALCSMSADRELVLTLSPRNPRQLAMLLVTQALTSVVGAIIVHSP